MLLLSQNLQSGTPQATPAPTAAPMAAGRHGFEMVGTPRESILQRMLEERERKRVKPQALPAQKKARVIEVKAANAVLADAGEQELRKLMNQWLKQKPPIPPKADPYEVFVGQVARRLRQMDEDEAILLLL